jgi:Ca-activated chloride channel homolog
MRARDALGFENCVLISFRRWHYLRHFCVLLSVLGGILFSVPAQSQSLDAVHVIPHGVAEQRTPLSDDASVSGRHLRVDVDLVLVPATVTDRMNRPLIDLQQQNFGIFENDARQQIRYFTMEDSPISIGLIVDVSKSMTNKIEAERIAISEFFENANPKDDYFAISLADRPHLIADTTQSLEQIEGKLALAIPAGHTALLDAIYLGISKMRDARYQRHALLIISDGGDNHSHYTLKEIKTLVQESDVLVYSVGIVDPLPVPVVKTIEEKLGQPLLSKITEASGGRNIVADKAERIPSIAAIISRELRQQYVLGYKSSNDAHDGKWRKIKLEVTAATAEAPLRAYYKRGYLSPER